MTDMYANLDILDAKNWSGPEFHEKFRWLRENDPVYWDAKNAICGYVIVEAESHEAAARMFLDHPHFSAFPGQSVEIIECLPMPKM